MTEREYLVSKGLAKPGRGRFSKEAKAALAKAREEGINFDESPGPKPKAKATSTPKPAPKPKAEKTVEFDTKSIDPKAVREWAAENGVDVSARGRIAREVYQSYLDAVKEPVPRPERNDDGVIVEAPQIRFAPTWYGSINGKTITRSVRDVCNNCMYSIGWCRCATPAALVGEEWVTLHDKPLV